MSRIFLIHLSFISIFTFVNCNVIQAGESDNVIETETFVEYKVEGEYANVRDDLELAITGGGIKINTIAHTGDMLIRTGKDIGAKKIIYKHAEAFEFCSATISRATMEADPRNFMFCPYIIYVYQLSQDKNTIYIMYRRPSYGTNKKSNKALRAVETMLKNMISEVVQ
ncbi:hypothetical protein MNBD_GAMMA22-1215 [hydrothermal vent metagenome]|uniref:DUF302 domain-containing protein n=1 Tax=hydrothermal vent metagenome TaxID=652676 RepID=A0A3B0ZYF1_9ZZZZ